MKKSDFLKQQRASKVEAQGKLLSAIKTETGTRDFSDDEQTQFSALENEIKGLDDDIRKAVEVETAEARHADLTAKPVTHATGGAEAREVEKMKKRYSIHSAIRSRMNGGAALSGVELEFHQEASKRAMEAGIVIEGLAVPLAEKRADGQTVTQDAGGFGANLVSTETQSPIEFLRPAPMLEAAGAQFLTGLQGNLKFPVNNGGIAATWEGEVANVANTKNAYASKTMTPKRLAVSVPIALQNILQSSISLERYTVEEMMAAVGQAIDIAGINGAGTGGVPEGILVATGTNLVVGGASGAAPTWAHMVGLETGVYVGNANSARMGYLFNAVTRGKLKTTKHEAGDLGYLLSADGTANGYPVWQSNNVPSNLVKGGSGAVCSAGIFGDFSQMIIGQWGFADLSVDEFSRKREGYVEITFNTFLDILIRQPKAFSVVKDWLTT
jgi:HK97 family phage major capsid protein